MPQVASDPKVHAPNLHMPRVARPAPSDRAPSPFESLIEDTLPPAEPAPPQQESKVAKSDDKQAPAKSKDCKAAESNDDTKPVNTDEAVTADEGPADESTAQVDGKKVAKPEVPPIITGTGTSSVSGALDNVEIASNFTTFLQLLTTQLKNQNPLDPLDTNQFTQQLVQFAQVEQQMKSNDLLSGLVLLEESSEATAALAYVGSTVVVDGSTAQLANSQAKWTLNVSKPSTATITIKDATTGQSVYTGTIGVNPGNQAFTWDGRGNDGRVWPDGSYR